MGLGSSRRPASSQDTQLRVVCKDLRLNSPTWRRQLRYPNIDRSAVETSVAQARAWWDANPSAIRRPEGSALHKLVEDWHAGIVVLPNSTSKIACEAFILCKPSVFLVQHNWAATLGDDFDFNDMEYRLPFDFCTLEFNISGNRVIHIESYNHGAVVALHAGNHWMAMHFPPGYLLPRDKVDGLAGVVQITGQNARALAVVIDSGVGIAARVPAAPALNKARTKSGKAAIADYHVVNLAAQRSALRDQDAGTGSKKRLHFRRGHYRHLHSGKTWVRWTLVGDPDLGFVEKRYRL